MLGSVVISVTQSVHFLFMLVGAACSYWVYCMVHAPKRLYRLRTKFFACSVLTKTKAERLILPLMVDIVYTSILSTD